MNSKVLEILRKERISVLSVESLDGTPHASTMAFVYKQEPLQIIFLTDKNSKKCESLLKGLSSKASFVIGFDEVEMLTLQMDGEVKIEEDNSKIEEIRKIYFEKYPDHTRYENDHSCYLVFDPIFWKYTDFKPIPNLVVVN